MMRWNSTKTYTEEDILRMQQEAVNRVHEFQSRAQEYACCDLPAVGAARAEPAPVPMIEAESRVVEPEELPAPPQQIQPAADPVKGFLERFSLDGETLLILGLIFVLYNEKADHVLLVALAYLLL